MIKLMGICLVLAMQSTYARGSASVMEVDSICAMVDQCDTSPRQILFLLDGSNSMNIDAVSSLVP